LESFAVDHLNAQTPKTAVIKRLAFRVALTGPLLVAALDAPAASPDWSAAVTVSVTAAEYDFTPNRLSFRRGEVYRLHLDNRGEEIHDFSAPDFFMTVEFRDPAVVGDAGRIAVRPGEQKDIYLVPREAGMFGAICADHDWAGMSMRIAVE